MKERITVTVERSLVREARRLAHERGASLSGFVASVLRESLHSQGRTGGTFAERWLGKFTLRESTAADPRLAALKARHGLA